MAFRLAELGLVELDLIMVYIPIILFLEPKESLFEL